MAIVRTGAFTTGIYRSYLVRFWQSNEQGCWRASAQCVQTNSTLLFGDVTSLFAFLQREIGESHPPPAPPNVHKEDDQPTQQ